MKSQKIVEMIIVLADTASFTLAAEMRSIKLLFKEEEKKREENKRPNVICK